MMVQPGISKVQQGTNERARNQKGKIAQKNQTLGTVYQPLCIMEEGEEEMGSQEIQHKKKEEEEEQERE
jgi:hypothetical protein